MTQPETVEYVLWDVPSGGIVKDGGASGFCFAAVEQILRRFLRGEYEVSQLQIAHEFCVRFEEFATMLPGNETIAKNYLGILRNLGCQDLSWSAVKELIDGELIHFLRSVWGLVNEGLFHTSPVYHEQELVEALNNAGLGLLVESTHYRVVYGYAMTVATSDHVKVKFLIYDVENGASASESFEDICKMGEMKAVFS